MIFHDGGKSSPGAVTVEARDGFEMLEPLAEEQTGPAGGVVLVSREIPADQVPAYRKMLAVLGLEARGLRLMRRTQVGRAVPREPVYRVGDLEIDASRHRVLSGGEVVKLTASQFKALQVMAGEPGRVFSREDLIRAIHGTEYSCTLRAVDVMVTAIRKRLGGAADCLETVRGAGYRIREQEPE